MATEPRHVIASEGWYRNPQVHIEAAIGIRPQVKLDRSGKRAAESGVESEKSLLISAAVMPSFRIPRKLGLPILLDPQTQTWASPRSLSCPEFWGGAAASPRITGKAGNGRRRREPVHQFLQNLGIARGGLQSPTRYFVVVLTHGLRDAIAVSI